MPRSSSSESEDAGLFAAAVVTAAALEEHSRRSMQVAQRRQVWARQRREGGGGILGRQGSGNGGEKGDSGFLDAAQLRVVEALQKRLEQELEEEEAAVATLPPQPAQQQAAESREQESAEEVRLFRRVPAGAPVVDQQAGSNQRHAQDGSAKQQADAAKADQAAQAGWRRKRGLEQPTTSRCRAVAVEAADILRAAEAAVQQRTGTITSPPGWLPADDDPSRWSQRRKRRAAKLAAEAAAWHPQHAALS